MRTLNNKARCSYIRLIYHTAPQQRASEEGRASGCGVLRSRVTANQPVQPPNSATLRGRRPCHQPRTTRAPEPSTSFRNFRGCNKALRDVLTLPFHASSHVYACLTTCLPFCAHRPSGRRRRVIGVGRAFLQRRLLPNLQQPPLHRPEATGLPSLPPSLSLQDSNTKQHPTTRSFSRPNLHTREDSSSEPPTRLRTTSSRFC